ncbi:MAG: DEAD/DEAH box helicase [Candidatus Thorarchaeota archaeon]
MIEPSGEPTPITTLIPEEYLDWFPFESFTGVQSQVIPAVFASDANILLCAPTGAGKTAIADAAILKLLLEISSGAIAPNAKAIYLAPMRALSYEKARNWEDRTGISTTVFTGEESPRAISDLNAYDLIISTPEKFDSASRKWRNPDYAFVSNVVLVIIDEVHLLDSDGRGDALEALVSRMQRIGKATGHNLRIVAMSATIPNVSDVAEWLGVTNENIFVFSEDERPVPLHCHVEGVPVQRNWTMTREAKNESVVAILNAQLEKSEDAQALVFVNSRKETEKLARFLLDTWDGKRGHAARFAYLATDDSLLYAEQVSSIDLQDMMATGVAFHHAGLSKDDRNTVEEAFRDGAVKVLCATTTIAWGVNLPARIVIVRDTTFYDSQAEGGWKLMSASDLKQMIGRAGRPGYDNVGYAFVIAPDHEKPTIEYLLRHGKKLSSRFLEVSTGHLLAEIVDEAISSRQDAVEWLDGTFNAVLLRPNCPALTKELQKQVDVDIEYLEQTGLITSERKTSDAALRATRWGQITSYYYLTVGTAEWFSSSLKKLQTDEQEIALPFIVEVLAEAMEFSELILRRSEERFVWSVQGIFPNFNRLSPPAQKVCYILYCYFVGDELPKILSSEAFTVRENALRLLGALSEFCEDILGYCPWILLKAQHSLRYRKAIEQIQPRLNNKKNAIIDIQFTPELEWLQASHGQIVTTIVKNVALVPIKVQISVTQDGTVLTQSEVEIKEVPWKFPFPLVGDSPGVLVYTVEVTPVGENNPLEETEIKSLEIEIRK